MVNTILAKRVNHIVAKGDNPAWPKGSKSRGFSTRKDDKVWLAKYLMWEFERANLLPFDYTDKLSPQQKGRISHRRFQLQVLMDVAYIQGHLEEYGILRRVDSYAASQALQVFSESDKSEDGMLPLIDKIYFP